MVNLISKMSLHEDEENQHGIKMILAEPENVATADRIVPDNENGYSRGKDCTVYLHLQETAIGTCRVSFFVEQAR